MKETNIQFELKSSGEIIIKNHTDDKQFIVDFESKKINASTLYDALVYTTSSKYSYLEDIVGTEDLTKTNYFTEVKGVVIDICNSINLINYPIEQITIDSDETVDDDTETLPF